MNTANTKTLTPEPSTGAGPNCAESTGSAPSPRFSRRDDGDNVCSAMYRGHGIACARHWRHKHVWLCQVVNAAGELVADYRHEGHDRRAMLIGAARAAELLPNR